MDGSIPLIPSPQHDNFHKPIEMLTMGNGSPKIHNFLQEEYFLEKGKMQLVLADTSAIVMECITPHLEIGRTMYVESGHINQCMSVYRQGHHRNPTDEEQARKDLVSEIMKTKDDIEDHLWIKVYSRGGSHKIVVGPHVPGVACIFKGLVSKFQEKVKISVFLKWDACNKMIDFVSLEGLAIDPKMFTCVGNSNSPINDVLKTPPKKMRIKLVADIGIIVPKEPSYAQKALEKGVHSDLIIFAGNGAEIKALKAFLSVCSPVLEAMLANGMEESQTGRVDMSDLSEEGVRAFLRYVYYGDLREPQQNAQVAYELLYASHKYDVRSLEAAMKTLLLDMKDEDIDKEWAFKIYMFTRNIDSEVEVKRKAIKVLCMQSVYPYAMTGLEIFIETFLAATNDDDIDVAVALKIYVFASNIESAVELKSKAFQILKTKWNEVESLQEFNDLFEKPSYSRTAKELCRDLAKALMAAST